MKKMKKINLLILTFLLVGLSISCSKNNDAYVEPKFQSEISKKVSVSTHRIVKFGVHPLYNPELMLKLFEPMMGELNKNIPGYKFRLESSKDYASYDEKLKNKEFDFALPNPYQTIQSIGKGYKVFGKMADDQGFKGIFLVRKDGKIKSLKDAKGKIFSFPAPTALAAAMMPQYYLYKKGIDPNKDIKVKYVGSQESSVLAAFYKESDVAVTWPQAYDAILAKNPELRNSLVIIDETQHLLSNSLMYREDVPSSLMYEVKRNLLNLHRSETGKIILSNLKLSQFEDANDSTYQPVEKFMVDFRRDIGSVKQSE